MAAKLQLDSLLDASSHGMNNPLVAVFICPSTVQLAVGLNIASEMDVCTNCKAWMCRLTKWYRGLKNRKLGVRFYFIFLKHWVDFSLTNYRQKEHTHGTLVAQRLLCQRMVIHLFLGREPRLHSTPPPPPPSYKDIVSFCGAAEWVLQKCLLCLSVWNRRPWRSKGVNPKTRADRFAFYSRAAAAANRAPVESHHTASPGGVFHSSTREAAWPH